MSLAQELLKETREKAEARIAELDAQIKPLADERRELVEVLDAISGGKRRASNGSGAKPNPDAIATWLKANPYSTARQITKGSGVKVNAALMRELFGEGELKTKGERAGMTYRLV